LPDKGFEDDQMVRKKERAIDKTERRKEVQEAVSNGKVNEEYTDKQRLTRIEKNIKHAEEIVDDLAEESLTLARRVVDLGRTVNREEQRLSQFVNRIDNLEIKAHNVEEEADKYEIKVDKKADTARDVRLRWIVIIIALGSAIFAGISVYISWSGGHP